MLASHLARPLFVLIAASFALWIAMPAGPAWMPQAQAQVRRCTTADGGTVFTDRLCTEVDAVERLPRDEAGASQRPYRGGCASTLQDLIYQVTSAIDARDGNRLATSYHWAGMSSRTGYNIIGRLDGIAQRPLVDITALRPAAPVVVAERPGVSAPIFDGNYYPQTSRQRRPTALRIDQMLADGITPSRTTFGLRRHMDCWWITL